MSKHILMALEKKLGDLSSYGGMQATTRRNALKEELQYYVLNFIYHHPEYGRWVMYGGSALRIIHGLNRMSVDLDFEISHPVTDIFLEKLKKEVEDYFVNMYGASEDFLTVTINNNRGLLLKFHIGEELNLGCSSDQVHVKIDLNHFVATKTITERRPINHNQLSFVILIYNMSSLMASKLAAIFLRGSRGVGKDTYSEKGRDIYDLLWYMEKMIVPDFDYLTAKKVDIKTLPALFDKLTLQMNLVKIKNLKDDLSPLFEDQNFIINWLDNWLENYFKLLDAYKIRTIKGLKKIVIYENFHTDNFSFTYWYETDNDVLVKIVYNLSDYWLVYSKGDLSIKVDEDIAEMIESASNGVSSDPTSQDKLKQYAMLFYEKNVSYLKKTNRTMLGDVIATKLIRMSATNLNQEEEIVLNKSALLSCELDDLFK